MNTFETVNMDRNQVILVDENDNAIGVMDKLLAHQNGGQRHRAFSIFILNNKDEILLQRRASTKYHAASLWSNTCCSHPEPEEDTKVSAHRRLKEELCLDIEELHHIGRIEYKAGVGNGLTEWEIDHLFLGKYHDQPIKPNPLEVSDTCWLPINTLLSKLKKEPKHFTPWLSFMLPSLQQGLNRTHVK